MSTFRWVSYTAFALVALATVGLDARFRADLRRRQPGAWVKLGCPPLLTPSREVLVYLWQDEVARLRDRDLARQAGVLRKLHVALGALLILVLAASAAG